MTNKINIRQFDQETKGYFIATIKEEEAGKMTYSWAGKNKIIIDHTEVNPKFRGLDVGKNMVMEAVAFARKNELTIIPLCPFARATFHKTPEFNDVLGN